MLYVLLGILIGVFVGLAYQIYKKKKKKGDK